MKKHLLRQVLFCAYNGKIRSIIPSFVDTSIPATYNNSIILQEGFGL